jgi:hypothetical protein
VGGVYSRTFRFVITVPANAPANSLLVGDNARVEVDPLVGPQREVVVPMNEIWVIKDVYVRSSGDVPVDCIVAFVKNGRKELQWTPPLSALNVANPARPRVDPMLFEGDSRLSIRAVNLAAGGNAAQTVVFYADVDVYEAGVDF